jgi:hypothetical protein
MVYSTPAGERERPRVRRSHEQKTRGEAISIQQGVSKYETAFQNVVTNCSTAWPAELRHVFVIVTLTT